MSVYETFGNWDYSPYEETVETIEYNDKGQVIKRTTRTTKRGNTWARPYTYTHSDGTYTVTSGGTVSLNGTA